MNFLIISKHDSTRIFQKDLFAEQTGVELLEVREGYSKACLVITENHLNAGHRTQGGAIFTLADLALAAAANSHGSLAFSLSSILPFACQRSGRRCMPKHANDTSDVLPDIIR